MDQILKTGKLPDDYEEAVEALKDIVANNAMDSESQDELVSVLEERKDIHIGLKLMSALLDKAFGGCKTGQELGTCLNHMCKTARLTDLVILDQFMRKLIDEGTGLDTRTYGEQELAKLYLPITEKYEEEQIRQRLVNMRQLITTGLLRRASGKRL